MYTPSDRAMARHEERESEFTSRLIAGGSEKTGMKPMKPLAPPRFNGDTTEIASTWLMTVKRYLEVTETPAAKQVGVVATYLSGKAATWWQTL